MTIDHNLESSTKKRSLPLVSSKQIADDVDVEAELKAFEESERARLGIRPSAGSGPTTCSSR